MCALRSTPTPAMMPGPRHMPIRSCTRGSSNTPELSRIHKYLLEEGVHHAHTQLSPGGYSNPRTYTTTGLSGRCYRTYQHNRLRDVVDPASTLGGVQCL